MRRQTDDASGWRGQSHRRTGVVAEHDFGLGMRENKSKNNSRAKQAHVLGGREFGSAILGEAAPLAVLQKKAQEKPC
jgi:hypothetical protein